MLAYLVPLDNARRLLMRKWRGVFGRLALVLISVAVAGAALASLLKSADGQVMSAPAISVANSPANRDDGVRTFAEDPLFGAGEDSHISIMNGGLGIDLLAHRAPEGVTPSASGNPGVAPSSLQNGSELTSAAVYSGGVLLEGALTAMPDRSCRLKFFANSVCDPTASGQGKRFLCAAEVTTDDGGSATFQIPCQSQVPEGQFITATAIDLTTGDTSAFPACRETVSLGVINNWLGQTHLQTVYNPADSMSPHGVYTVTATFQNTTVLTLTNLSFRVIILEYRLSPHIDPNLLLLNADGAPGGVGATLSTPDEIAPGELF